VDLGIAKTVAWVVAVNTLEDDVIHVTPEGNQVLVKCTDHPDYLAAIIPAADGVIPAGLVITEMNEHLRNAHIELPADIAA